MQRIISTSKLVRYFFIFLALIVISIGHVSCASDSSKKNGSLEKKNEAKPSMPIKFVVEASHTVIQDRLAQSRTSEIETIKEEETRKISTLVQQYYQVAFLKPALWENGKFSKLDSFFAPRIRSRVRDKDFNSLCLGDNAKKMDYLKSLEAKIPAVWINIDKGLKPQLCAVTAEVKGGFIQKDGNTARFSSSATFFLEPGQDGQWQIFDYDLKYQLRSEEKSK